MHKFVELQHNFCTVCLKALALTQILRSVSQECLHDGHAAEGLGACRAVGSKPALVAGLPLPVCAPHICLGPCTDRKVTSTLPSHDHHDAVAGTRSMGTCFSPQGEDMCPHKQPVPRQTPTCIAA